MNSSHFNTLKMLVLWSEIEAKFRNSDSAGPLLTIFFFLLPYPKVNLISQIASGFDVFLSFASLSIIKNIISSKTPPVNCKWIVRDTFIVARILLCCWIDFHFRFYRVVSQESFVNLKFKL